MKEYRTQEQLVIALREQLSTNPNQAVKALISLYNRQTEDEKKDGDTKHSNGVGFTSRDSSFLTSLAESYLRYGHLTQAQMVHLMHKIPKYAHQLIIHSISSGKIRKENGFYIW